MIVAKDKIEIRLLSRAEAMLLSPRAWERLAEASVTPNPFFERWCLLPALDNFEPEVKVRVVAVYRQHRLVALVPVCVRRKFGLFRYLSVWRYPACLLGDVLREADVDMKPVFLEVMRRLRIPLTLAATHTDLGLGVSKDKRVYRLPRCRAALTQKRSWEEYQSSRPGKQRKEDKRVTTRLMEKVGASYVTANGKHATRWLQHYFDIEDSSWRSGDAQHLRADVDKRRFYEQAVKAGAEQGKVEFQAIFKDEKPIAMAFRFKAQKNAYEIKTAYRCEHRKLYPGVVLELLTLQELMQKDFEVVDSCAWSNWAVDRIWPDRITLYRSVMFSDSVTGYLVGQAYRIYLRLINDQRPDFAV